MTYSYSPERAKKALHKQSVHFDRWLLLDDMISEMPKTFSSRDLANKVEERFRISIHLNGINSTLIRNPRVKLLPRPGRHCPTTWGRIQ
jgi:hypothetical protein